MRTLDRMVAATFVRIFSMFVLSVPIMFILADQSEKQGLYVDRELTMSDIVLGYFFEYPKFVLWSFPVAALVGTVFTIHSMTVNREIQAAKAGGISFHRLIVPLWPIGAVLTVAAFLLGMVVTVTNRKAEEVFAGDTEWGQPRAWRNAFVFQTEHDETLGVQQLSVGKATMGGVLLESLDEDGSLRHVWADEGVYTTEEGWTLRDGYLRVIRPDGREASFRFDSHRRPGLTPTPEDLLQNPPDDEEMTYEELGRQAAAVHRSGGDPRKLLVGREQKLAIPAATLVIMLFGAPLATTVKKGGAAFGVGVSLGSTLVYILLLRLFGAIGITGGLPPVWAAWTPNLLFLVVGVVLLARVRT
ncbi:MAG: LptF/LptG family permease [Gemmatimonadota bacterium]|nr:LptF/LptG family permease [Gemmatimonadota bacterium]